MFESDVTPEPIDRDRVRELLVCSPHRVHTLIRDGVLRSVAHDDNGQPLFSSQDCFDLYFNTMRGMLMRFGPHPRDN